MENLSLMHARFIIDRVGSSGNPPEYGARIFSVGLDEYLAILNDEYLQSFIKNGGSVFKMVIGLYGGGKSHFLYCIRDLAWEQNYVISYVSLSQGASPFHKLELVYASIVKNIKLPLPVDERIRQPESGLGAFLRRWLAELRERYNDKSKHEFKECVNHELASLKAIQSVSFSKAIGSAILALLDEQEDDFNTILQWLNGETYSRSIHGKYGILQKIDKTSAFEMIRSLCQFVRAIGHPGLVILLDEAERVPSLGTKQKDIHLSNLREIIDECGHTSFQGVMIFYAVPDRNFLDGNTQIYEALKQRVATIFDILNPTGVCIELEKLSKDRISFLKEVGEKLAIIYEKAYSTTFDKGLSARLITMVAQIADAERFSDIGYKRVFVQKIVQGFHYLKIKKQVPTADDLKGS